MTGQLIGLTSVDINPRPPQKEDSTHPSRIATT